MTSAGTAGTAGAIKIGSCIAAVVAKTSRAVDVDGAGAALNVSLTAFLWAGAVIAAAGFVKSDRSIGCWKINKNTINIV